MVLSLLNRDYVVVVLFGEDLSILDGLDRGVVVVLVDLTVNGSLDLLMAGLLNSLVHNGWGNLLVDGGVMFTRLVPKDPMMSVLFLRDTSIVWKQELMADELSVQFIKVGVQRGGVPIGLTMSELVLVEALLT